MIHLRRLIETADFERYNSAIEAAIFKRNGSEFLGHPVGSLVIHQVEFREETNGLREVRIILREYISPESALLTDDEIMPRASFDALNLSSFEVVLPEKTRG